MDDSSSPTDESLKDLYLMFKGQRSIKRVHINFTWSELCAKWFNVLTCDSCREINDQGIQSVRKGLKTLVSLKKVQFNFTQ